MKKIIMATLAIVLVVSSVYYIGAVSPYRSCFMTAFSRIRQSKKPENAEKPQRGNSIKQQASLSSAAREASALPRSFPAVR